MKILFDHGTPAPLRPILSGHHISTAYEMGWAGLSNGALLKVADAEFDILITTDKNLRYQQNVSSFRLAIPVLPTTSWPKIRSHQTQVVDAVNTLRPGEIAEPSWP